MENAYDVVVRIGTIALSEDEALDNLSDILFFIQDNLSLENYEIYVEKKGEYL